ncbi:MAG TPA: MOSC domain-containing protein [Nocardioidaceae bacterium]|nr:MOSC domain-containing protein [Nocardioidaceae bacterium]
MIPHLVPHLTSVNVGRSKQGAWAGRVGWTAIDKRPVDVPVTVGALGLAGDEVADTKYHGGADKAVYAFAQEDLHYWTEQLGDTVAPGLFGENLTTVGLDLNEAVLGERWHIGTTVLQVCHVRIPCSVFKAWLGRSGFDDTAWVKRFAEVGRPGAYLRVLQEGELRTGDPVRVEARPAHGITIGTMFRALTSERSWLPRLLEVDDLPREVVEAVHRYLAAAAR